jgi:hypothetical protein
MREFIFEPGLTRFAGFRSVTEVNSQAVPYIKNIGLITLIEDQGECYEGEATSFETIIREPTPEVPDEQPIEVPEEPVSPVTPLEPETIIVKQTDP